MTGLTGAIEELSVKLGLVLLVVGILHLFNVYLLNRLRGSRLSGGRPVLMTATLGGVPGTPAARSSRGTQTRTLILDTALRMFREDGYEATTMRAVAAAAGVSVGNAYYYFESKEHLVQAYYEEIGRLHRSLALPRIAEVGGLADRLRIALATHLEVIEPYHSFAGSFFKGRGRPVQPAVAVQPGERAGPGRGDRLLPDRGGRVLGPGSRRRCGPSCRGCCGCCTWA